MKADAIEALYAKYYNDALLYTLSLSRNKAVAEDIVGAAFYKAIGTADDSVINFKAWLLRVCRNLYFNHLRRYRKETELDEKLADERENAFERLIKEETFLALHRAVELLKGEQKEVILLFYFENLSVAEVAVILEKSESNVKVLLHRARAALKEILEVTL